MIEFAESGPLIKKAARNEAAVPDVYRSSVKVVAGVGFEPTKLGLLACDNSFAGTNKNIGLTNNAWMIDVLRENKGECRGSQSNLHPRYRGARRAELLPVGTTLITPSFFLK